MPDVRLIQKEEKLIKNIFFKILRNKMAVIFENQFFCKIHLLIIDFLVQGIEVELLNCIFLLKSKIR